MSEVVALLEDALKDVRGFLRSGDCQRLRPLNDAQESIEAALRVYRAEQAMSEDEARL